MGFTVRISSLAILALAAAGAEAELNPCRFNFGLSWAGPTAAYPQDIDYVSIWAGSDENFNVYWVGEMLKACKPGGKLAGKTPVYYSYIIAFTAKADLKINDCNMGSPNLCEQGSNFMRQKKTRILAQYEKYASETAKVWGTEKPIVWMMEPDYYQYASDTKQAGGPLTFAEAGAYMGELVAVVKKHLPNAVFSMDISPWIANPSQWYGAFKMGDFTYMNTSGGDTEANNTRIRTANPMTWKSIHDLIKKPIIADDGYAVGGASTGHDATWDDVANLNARIGDGVIAITQANPKSDWGNAISAVRPQLRAVQGCQTGILRPVARRPGHSFLFRNRDFLGRDPGGTETILSN